MASQRLEFERQLEVGRSAKRCSKEYLRLPLLKSKIIFKNLFPKTVYLKVKKTACGSQYEKDFSRIKELTGRQPVHRIHLEWEEYTSYISNSAPLGNKTRKEALVNPTIVKNFPPPAKAREERELRPVPSVPTRRTRALNKGTGLVFIFSGRLQLP